jgi:hypothetical protein
MESDLQHGGSMRPAYGQPSRSVTPGCANPWRQLVASALTAVVMMSTGIAVLNALMH